MTTERVERVVRGTLKAKTTKEGVKGAFLELQILRPGMQYPDVVQCFEPKALEHLALGAEVALVLQRGNLRKDKADDGAIGSYYWQAVKEAEEPAAASAVAPRPSQGPEAPARPSGEAPGPPAKHPVHDKDTSIERQVALKAAVELAGYQIAKGQEVKAEDVTKVAAWFAAWLRGG